MEHLQIVETEDGSSTIYNSQLRETYHSTHGALTESIHVFIKNGLAHFWKQNPHLQKISILEVGFGTGLNSILALQWAKREKTRIFYETIEAYPLTLPIIKNLNYFKGDVELRSALISFHETKWNNEKLMDEYFYLKKVHRKLEEYSTDPGTFDIIFYDAFAPSKQEEMWSKELIAKIIGFLRPNGIFVTYCAKGQLQRDLKQLDCMVEKLPGPPGKKEMVRATKIHTPFQV